MLGKILLSCFSSAALIYNENRMYCAILQIFVGSNGFSPNVINSIIPSFLGTTKTKDGIDAKSKPEMIPPKTTTTTT